MRTLFDAWRALSRRAAANVHPNAQQVRRTAFEPLEDRHVLSANAAIAGVVFTDLTGNGLTADDTLNSGVEVRLFRDNGDGIFQGAGVDTQQGVQNTVNGAFRFENLTAGTYFVQQAAIPGTLEGFQVQKITITAQQALGANGIAIDSFSAGMQIVEATSAAPQASSSLAVAGVLGGERDLFVKLNDGTFGRLSISVLDGAPLMEFNASATGQGQRVITWDGVDNNGSVLNPTGLGGVDLTESGQNFGFLFNIGADLAGGTATFRVYTDANNWSEAVINIPQTGGIAGNNVIVPFSTFTIGAGSGANFANVGAVQLSIVGASAADGQVNFIGTIRPDVSNIQFANHPGLSIGDTVWLDSDGNGVQNGAEQGINGVLVNLYRDVDGNNQYTAGVDTMVDTTFTSGGGKYFFTDLGPGAYVVQIDPSNFVQGGPLHGMISTSPDFTPDPDNDVDLDDNGLELGPNGVLSYAVTLTTGGEPQNGGNANHTIDFGFCKVVDVAIVKTDTPDPVSHGGTLTYTLTITNHGPATATGVTVTDQLPEDVTFVSASGTPVSNVNGLLTFNLGTLTSGQSATITIITSVKQTAADIFSNTAEVTSIEKDIDLSNNKSTVTTSTKPRIDLSVVKVDSADPVVHGDQYDYVITVKNNGPKAATGVVVTDTLPGEVTFVSASGATFTRAGQVVTFQIGNMAVGEERTLRITVDTDSVDIPAGASTRVLNVVEVSANEEETNYSNNFDDEETLIDRPIIQQNVGVFSGYVYHDFNNNGTFDGSESGINGVTMTLRRTDAVQADMVVVTSNNGLRDGYYEFTNFPLGTYVLIETQPAGWSDGQDTPGTPLLAGIDLSTNDRMANLVFAIDDLSYENYNFGERLSIITKRNLIRRGNTN